MQLLCNTLPCLSNPDQYLIYHTIKPMYWLIISFPTDTAHLRCPPSQCQQELFDTNKWSTIPSVLFYNLVSLIHNCNLIYFDLLSLSSTGLSAWIPALPSWSCWLSETPEDVDCITMYSTNQFNLYWSAVVELFIIMCGVLYQARYHHFINTITPRTPIQFQILFLKYHDYILNTQHQSQTFWLTVQRFS